MALILLAAYGVGWRLARSGDGATSWAGDTRIWLARVRAIDDAVADFAWDKGLAAILAVVCMGALATWVPHYLTWPWSRDADTFAVLAQSWDRGILPYRDIRAYNFPGETYLFWVLAKAFGRGRTLPFYAVDAGCVLILGAVAVGWSRRKLGGAVPGLIGYLSFLSFYLSLGFAMVGERDWHTAFLVCLGVMVAEAWPGRWSRLGSALATALALSIRPHAILFLPALASATAEPALATGPGRRSWTLPILEWSLWLMVFLCAVVAPLIAAEIVNDLIRGLRIAGYGGPYSKATPALVLECLLDQFSNWRTDVPLALTFCMAIRAGGELRPMARTWSLAWLGALVYRPVHPVQHMYLIHPLMLVSSITWSFPVSYWLSLRWLSRPVRIVAVALLAYEIMPIPPWMCSPSRVSRR